MPLFPQLSTFSIISNNFIYYNGKNVAGKKNINYDLLIGKKFNKWTIVSYYSAKEIIMICCICECGNKSNIQSFMLRNNLSKSCKHCAAKKHGFYNTATYRVWNGARNRCNNPNNKNYKSYGARGIKFSEKWDMFIDFLADMGEKPKKLTLDRIDNDGNYEPGNCRWTTPLIQRHNQRRNKKKE